MKDEYGAIQVGKAIVRPDKLNKPTKQMYENTIVMTIARSMYKAFRSEETKKGDKVLKMELAILPNKNYEKMKRKIRRLEKKLEDQL